MASAVFKRPVNVLVTGSMSAIQSVAGCVVRQERRAPAAQSQALCGAALPALRRRVAQRAGASASRVTQKVSAISGLSGPKIDYGQSKAPAVLDVANIKVELVSKASRSGGAIRFP